MWPGVAGNVALSPVFLDRARTASLAVTGSSAGDVVDLAEELRRLVDAAGMVAGGDQVPAPV